MTQLAQPLPLTTVKKHILAIQTIPSQEHAPFMTRMLRAVMRVMPCWHTVVASTTPYRHESTSTALAILSEACAFLQISSYFPPLVITQFEKSTDVL